MSNCPFCNLDPPADAEAPEAGARVPADVPQRMGFLRRAWRGVQWLFPTFLLAFMPKCPMCVVGYVALFTGVGITVSTAWWIKGILVGFCWTALLYLTARLWRARTNGRKSRMPRLSTCPPLHAAQTL